MKPVFIDFNNNPNISLYVQLYDYLKREIIEGGVNPGERLPSLRALSSQIQVSITTCSRAYDQLLLEGYIESKPQSGYYVADLKLDRMQRDFDRASHDTDRMAQDAVRMPHSASSKSIRTSGESHDDALDSSYTTDWKYYTDPGCFDFTKWKKCAVDVITYQKESLLSPADPQGEYALRSEISEYLYRARGVNAPPSHIVISAGVQQLTNHLARILSLIGIDIVNVEDPGYKPVQHIFRDRGFTLNKVPVRPDGIDIDRLPVNMSTAAYVSPSNQFPTGSVMTAARRFSLLKWADDNGSIIIEDDYDSELRYFGDPVPALKSLDENDCTVYLGSFSSTLFPAIRISYMVLPERLSGYFERNKSDYDQTCSKIEQLTLASFMERGFYQSGIRKLRKLYASKLSKVISSFRQYGGDTVKAKDSKSGINIRLGVNSEKNADELCSEAESLKLHIVPLPECPSPGKRLLFYYDQIPEEAIDSSIRSLCLLWKDQ